MISHPRVRGLAGLYCMPFQHRQFEDTLWLKKAIDVTVDVITRCYLHACLEENERLTGCEMRLSFQIASRQSREQGSKHLSRE